jgi:adhesin transport system outer membrane protein
MTKTLKKLLLTTILVGSLCAPTVATSQAEELNLADAVTRGMLTNPEYGVVANNRRATDEELDQAKGLYLPSVDLRADGGVEYTDDVGTRGRGLDDESLARYDASATLTQMLFDGFAARSEVSRQESRVESATHRVHETAEFVGLDIVDSYLEVLRQRELLAIARANVQEHLIMLNEIRSAESAGRSTVADVAQADARLASARANESSVRQSLRDAEARFIEEVGMEPDALIIPSIPVDAVTPTVDDAVRTGLAESPTLDIFESDMDVAWSEFEAAGASFYPEVDLQLNARQGHDQGGVEGRDTSASALVVMNWNVYRGGIDTALRREHVYRHAQAKESRVQAARELERDIRQTWAAMLASGERAVEFSAQAEANERVVAAYKDQFDLDRRTLLDVLDSQNELFVSRSNTVNAEYLEMLAVFRLLALQGRLLDAIGVQEPYEAVMEDLRK